MMHPTWTSTPDDLEQCPYCGSQFRESTQLRLHKGVAHPAQVTLRERGAYERAERAEEEALRLYRLNAVGIPIVLYFFLLMAFALFA